MLGCCRASSVPFVPPLRPAFPSIRTDRLEIAGGNLWPQERALTCPRGRSRGVRRNGAATLQVRRRETTRGQLALRGALPLQEPAVVTQVAGMVAVDGHINVCVAVCTTVVAVFSRVSCLTGMDGPGLPSCSGISFSDTAAARTVNRPCCLPLLPPYVVSSLTRGRRACCRC